jgi:hypothetical protein
MRRTLLVVGDHAVDLNRGLRAVSKLNGWEAECVFVVSTPDANRHPTSEPSGAPPTEQSVLSRSAKGWWSVSPLAALDIVARRKPDALLIDLSWGPIEARLDGYDEVLSEISRHPDEQVRTAFQKLTRDPAAGSFLVGAWAVFRYLSEGGAVQLYSAYGRAVWDCLTGAGCDLNKVEYHASSSAHGDDVVTFLNRCCPVERPKTPDLVGLWESVGDVWRTTASGDSYVDWAHQILSTPGEPRSRVFDAVRAFLGVTAYDWGNFLSSDGNLLPGANEGCKGLLRARDPRLPTVWLLALSVFNRHGPNDGHTWTAVFHKDAMARFQSHLVNRPVTVHRSTNEGRKRPLLSLESMLVELIPWDHKHSLKGGVPSMNLTVATVDATLAEAGLELVFQMPWRAFMESLSETRPPGMATRAMWAWVHTAMTTEEPGMDNVILGMTEKTLPMRVTKSGDGTALSWRTS